MSAAPFTGDTPRDELPMTPELRAILGRLLRARQGGGGIVFESRDEPTEPNDAEPGAAQTTEGGAA
jgi:hypothetical protein